MTSGALGRVFGKERSDIDSGEIWIEGTPFFKGPENHISKIIIGPGTAIRFLKEGMLGFIVIEVLYFFDTKKRFSTPEYWAYQSINERLKDIGDYDPYSFYGKLWVKDTESRSEYEFSRAQIQTTGKVFPVQDSDSMCGAIRILALDVTMKRDEVFTNPEPIDVPPEPHAGHPPPKPTAADPDCRFDDLLEDF